MVPAGFAYVVAVVAGLAAADGLGVGGVCPRPSARRCASTRNAWTPRWRPAAASLWHGVVVTSSVVALSCCGRSWVGPDRAHCCARHGGCGQVFDDADLWDAHRARSGCRNPAELAEMGWIQTKNGIWLRH